MKKSSKPTPARRNPRTKEVAGETERRPEPEAAKASEPEETPGKGSTEEPEPEETKAPEPPRTATPPEVPPEERPGVVELVEGDTYEVRGFRFRRNRPVPVLDPRILRRVRRNGRFEVRDLGEGGSR